MDIHAIVDDHADTLNQRLFLYAAAHLPALVIDCANAADPHRFYPQISLAALSEIYIFELDLLHKFRDVLRHVPLYARQLKVQSIVITTSDHLINYHDEEENRNVYLHAWHLIRQISRRHTVVVGVLRGSDQHTMALKFCRNMRQ